MQGNGSVATYQASPAAIARTLQALDAYIARIKGPHCKLDAIGFRRVASRTLEAF